jgi:hypothetical protein
MKTRFAALAAILVPATALAQAPDPNDPMDPNDPDDLSEPDVPPDPSAATEPATPPPPPDPVVIVNPPPRTTVVAPVEPEYETYTDTWNAPVFTSGALVFLGSYGASVVVAASSEDDTFDRGNDRLYVPVVGPWLALNERPDCPILNESCDMETTKKVLLVADGILQAGGVITMIAGLLSPTEHTVVRRPGLAKKKVHVVPTAAYGGAGVNVFGRF